MLPRGAVICHLHSVLAIPKAQPVAGGVVKVADVARLVVMNLLPLLPLAAMKPLAVVVSVNWATRRGPSLPHLAEDMSHLGAVASRKMVHADVRRIESRSMSLRLHLRKRLRMANTGRELSNALEGSRWNRWRSKDNRAKVQAAA